MSAQMLDEPPSYSAVGLRSRGLELVLARVDFARWREPSEDDDPAACRPGKARLLELGAPLAANIHALNAYRCRLYVADAYRDLSVLSLDEAVAAADSVLPMTDDEDVHAVFAWDLFSFLDPLVVTAVATALGRHCSSGSLLHALAYTGEQMPTRPASVRMLGGASIEYHADTPALRANPRYSPVALERLLPGFSLRHSFLLPGGLQDYLFAFE